MHGVPSGRVGLCRYGVGHTAALETNVVAERHMGEAVAVAVGSLRRTTTLARQWLPRCLKPLVRRLAVLLPEPPLRWKARKGVQQWAAASLARPIQRREYSPNRMEAGAVVQSRKRGGSYAGVPLVVGCLCKDGSLRAAISLAGDTLKIPVTIWLNFESLTTLKPIIVKPTLEEELR